MTPSKVATIIRRMGLPNPGSRPDALEAIDLFTELQTGSGAIASGCCVVS